MRKKLPLVFVMVGFLTTLGSVASGQQSADAALQTSTAPKQKALVGSWVETVTFPPEFGSPPVKGVGSFHADGTLIFSGSVTTEPPAVFSSFHGVWTHLEKRTFAYTGLHLNTDLSNNLVGYVKVRGTYVVSASGNEYTGASVAEIFDSGGNFIFSVEVTNAGKRIQLELP
jgi:hypothetical protein